MDERARRRVVILGSSGSIGTQALDVVRAHPDRFEVVGLAVGRDTARLARQVDEFRVPRVSVADPSAAAAFAADRETEVLDGPGGAISLASVDADLVVNAMTGAIGLEPTLAALASGTPVALANKESLIVGGSLVTAAADAAGSRETHLIPVDSEHSALAQALRSGRRDEVSRLILTASGGPFRGFTREQLTSVTVAEALSHPTWSMGPMVTINSATLMNKGLELIEAAKLFDASFDEIDVVVHPQSVVHSMVEFIDGSTLAQLSPPDMRLPIQLAMAWPARLGHAFSACDWSQAGQLTFEPVDRDTFAALDLAVRAGRRGGGHPAVLNAANEVAVAAFVDREIGFLDIPRVVERVLDDFDATSPPEPRDVADVLDTDGWARRRATARLREQGRR